MAMLDISKGFKQYSSEELRSLAYSGHISCGKVDLSDFLEYIFQGVEFDIEKRLDEAYHEGYDAGKLDCDCWDED
jgi:hypothetical protein